MNINYNKVEKVPFSDIENGQSFINLDGKSYVKFFSELTKEYMALQAEQCVAIRMDDDIMVTPRNRGIRIVDKIENRYCAFSRLSAGDVFKFKNKDEIYLKLSDTAWGARALQLRDWEVVSIDAVNTVLPLYAELNVSEL